MEITQKKKKKNPDKNVYYEGLFDIYLKTRVVSVANFREIISLGRSVVN